MPVEYQRGVVESYNEKAGYGYVIPDESQEDGQRLLVHRRSLRDLSAQIEEGDRIVYRVELVPRGLLATDVVLETQVGDESVGEDKVTEATGTIRSINFDNGFGRIDAGKQTVFFRLAEAHFQPSERLIGEGVVFQLLETSRGPEARSVMLSSSLASVNAVRKGASQNSPSDLLPLAIIARDGKDFAQAVKLYQRGIRETPSVQLVTSYAAMEKNRNRRNEAIAIYEQGIELYPTNLKLLGDAGVLAASIGNHRKALELLERGLQLCRDSERQERVFLLAIARVYGSRPTLKATLCVFFRPRLYNLRSDLLFLLWDLQGHGVP